MFALDIQKNPFKTYIIMKKSFIDWAVFCLWVVGTIGGVGVALYNKSYFIAICVAALAVMAFPRAKKVFEK